MLQLQLVFYFMKWRDNVVFIGKVVSTHGIKGEIRILSSFEFKSKVFQVGNEIIIDNQTYTIKSYRVHKKFDMVTLEGFNNINDVLFLLKQKVFVKKDLLELTSDEVLDEDLISFNVLTTEGKKGIIKEIFYASENNKVLRILIDEEQILIPYFSPLVKEVDKENKQILIEILKGM